MMNRWKKLAIISSLCLLPSVSGLAYEQKAIYEKPDGSNIGARTTFGYKDDSMFKVNTKPGFVTDIQLREGEELTYVAGGDTKSWLIDKAKVGSVQHVYIKPLEPGKHTNIIINTDMHTYRLDVWSSMDAFDPLITFAFMGDRKVQQSNFGTENFLPPNDKKLNRDYTIKAKKMEKYSELIPSSIVDDGQRTYIRVPDTNKYDMPVLYLVNPWDGKQTLVNYRVQGGYFVADAVMAHGRLFYHQKYKVDFYNNAKQHSMSEQEKINNRRDSDTIHMSEWGMNRSEPSYDNSVAMNPVEEEVYVAPQEVRQVEVPRPRKEVKSAPIRVARPETRPVAVAPKVKTAVADMVARDAETGKSSSYKRPEVQGLFEQPIIEVRGYGPGQYDNSNVVKYVPPFVDSQDSKDALKAQMAQEKAQRIAQEKAEAQRRLEQERAIAKANADRIAYEKEQARLVKEREAQMRAQQAEQARLEKARLAEQAKMQAEQERLQKAQMAEKARLEKARQAEFERQQALQLKAEQARQAELARQQKEQEKLEKARIAEYNRQQAEQAKAEKLRQEQLQRQQAEQMKAEQLRQAQLEKERIANEKRMEKERQAQIRAQEAQMRAQQAEQAKLEKARQAEQARLEKARQAEQARLQAEQEKAQRAQLAQQQAAQRQAQQRQAQQQVAQAPVIDKNFVQQVDNIHGPVQVMLSDGRVVPMREDQFRKLPLESRVQLVAQNRVRRG